MSNSNDTPNHKTQSKVQSQPGTITCPNENTSKWNSHPRIYLQFGNSKKVTCPYCGTQYTTD
jgi:uncharacterized Zn-finger protein